MARPFISPNVLTRPIFVGIGGDSGTGKTTLASAFYRLFGEERITTICLDDYHSLDRRQRELVGFTALDPRANNFYLMEEQMWQLKRGETIQKPIYDHSDGHIRGPETVQPREVVIVQGLHPFLATHVRHAFDLKVWLDPEPELRLAWKVQRDTAKRGYNVEQVEKELRAREPDSRQWIEPQRAHADLVVRFFRPGPEAPDMGHLNVRITQRRPLPRLAFDREIEGSGTVRIRQDAVDDDGCHADIIEIDGAITPEEAGIVETNVWGHVDARHHHLRHVPREDLGAYEGAGEGAPPSKHSDPLELTQLILAHRILSAQKSTLVRVTADESGELVGHHQPL
ncbi:MAG: phosphoribulokinase [Candidatus Dormibacteria bacterium]